MIQRIDGHAHLPVDGDLAMQWLRSNHHAIVNICVDTDEIGGDLETQRAWHRGLRQESPEHFAWITSFSLSGFGSDGWADRAITQLRQDFEARATACKIWKNVGMSLVDETGAWVFADDARFAPIFDFLERENWPLMMHIADPLQAWRELDPESPHYSYYRGSPQWHLHGRADVASHERLIESRDHVLEKYPKLRIVGAHLGSQEHDLEAVGERLIRFSNYVVDTSARLGDMAVHARRDVDATRAFVHRWQDRIIWGMDWILFQPLSRLTIEEQRAKVAEMESRIAKEEAFYRGSGNVVVNAKETPALGLSDDVWEKISLRNALSVYFPKRAMLVR